MSAKKILVIGAGLGGRQAGYEVTVFEKNAHLGGKLNLLQAQGYTFDLGPSILTLPHIFERLFTRSGRRMADYFTLRALRPHWRNFFEDGVTLDLYPEPEKMAAEARKVGEPPENIERFLAYSARLYDLTNDGYFEAGWMTGGNSRSITGPGNSSSSICSAPCTRAWRRTCRRNISATSLISSSNMSALRPIARRRS